jgi:hypothetical protein
VDAPPKQRNEPRSVQMRFAVLFCSTANMASPFLNSVAAKRMQPWLITGVVVGALAAAYHFAEPLHTSPGFNSSAGVHAGIHLENVPFVAYSGSRLAWSLKAKSIDITHSQYTSSAAIQSAQINEISEGTLYPSDPSENSLLPFSTAADAKQPISPDKPLLTFKAAVGHYYVGGTHPLTPDLAANYTCRWQLVLEGNVRIQTRDGDELRTDRLTMLGLTGISNHKEEQRLECDAGAVIARKDVSITANRMRYALEDHTVELLNGVRMVYKNGSVQSDRTFWELKANVVRIPDRCSGIMNESSFTAGMLTLDLKQDTIHAYGLQMFLGKDQDGMPVLPTIAQPGNVPRIKR